MLNNFSKRTHCKNGHEFSAENTRIEPRSGARVCRTCQKLRSRVSVVKNAEMIKEQRAATKSLVRDKKTQLVEYKGGKCIDCGGVFSPCCYHFDHRDPFSKKAGIAKIIHRPLEELKTEADKCDLVCANCHAIRTFGDERIGAKISVALTGKYK